VARAVTGTRGVPDHINFIGPFLASWFGRGTWVQLTCPTCGDSLTLRRPSPHRIEWYLSIHRCGPPLDTDS
jgi:hypothetical protein